MPYFSIATGFLTSSISSPYSLAAYESLNYDPRLVNINVSIVAAEGARLATRRRFAPLRYSTNTNFVKAAF